MTTKRNMDPNELADQITEYGIRFGANQGIALQERALIVEALRLKAAMDAKPSPTNTQTVNLVPVAFIKDSSGHVYELTTLLDIPKEDAKPKHEHDFEWRPYSGKNGKRHFGQCECGYQTYADRLVAAP